MSDGERVMVALLDVERPTLSRCSQADVHGERKQDVALPNSGNNEHSMFDNATSSVLFSSLKKTKNKPKPPWYRSHRGDGKDGEGWKREEVERPHRGGEKSGVLAV